ncbi:MAG: hypothetical protein MUF42_10950 [Cytophagaceae bacterium]|nr:hypothetical protein [Cytophagaceae bacterium]
MRKLFLVVSLVVMNLQASAQTFLIGTANGGDFEFSGTNSLAANGWSSALPTTNRWTCNTLASGNTTHSAYIRLNTGSTAHSYNTNVASVTHLWRDVTFPAGQHIFQLSFDWISNGEPGYDNLKVFLIPTTTTPAAGVALTSGQIGATEYSGSTGWANTSFYLNSNLAGSSARLVFSWQNDNNTGSAPPAAIDNVLLSYSPTIIMPSSGSSTVSTCNSSFYDPGITNNYSDNLTSVLTIQPSTPGSYVSISFSSFNLEGRRDFLFIYDGTSTNASLLAGYNGNSIPATITATSNNPSGCLTLKFVSDWNNDNNAGWIGQISCGAAATPPVFTDNRNCYNSTLICSDNAFTGNNTGEGIHELFSEWIPCAVTGEDQANWFYFRLNTSGTIGFTIDPGASVDYDFAIWGPYSSMQCPANTFHTPVRCSYSELFGLTGLGNGATDASEPASGDKWVEELNANAGELFILYINNYSISSTAFNFNWNLSNGASLDCTPLPVDLSGLVGEIQHEGNMLRWSTTFEINSETFQVQRSEDGILFSTIHSMKAAQHSDQTIHYQHLDANPLKKSYFYRLAQIDLDGRYYYSNTIHLKNKPSFSILSLSPNPAPERAILRLSADSEERIELEILNAMGQAMFREEIMLQPGLNEVEIPCEQYEHGIYFIKLKSRKQMYQTTQSFVVH